MATIKTIQIIANLLERKSMSQVELAKKLGIGESAFSRIMKGSRKISADELNEMADIFGVTTDYLLGRKVNLGSTPVAAHMDDNLTEEQKKDIADYIEFKKAQYKKENESKNK